MSVPRRVLVLLAFAAVLGPGVVPDAVAQRAEQIDELMLERRFVADAGDRLVIDVADADVRVVPGNDDELRIEIWLSSHSLEAARARYARMNFTASERDGQVTVRGGEDVGSDGWSWRRLGGFNLVIQATVPVRTDVDVRTGDGDIAIRGLSGKFKVASQDGDIVAEGLRGRVELATEDGDIGVRSVDGPLLDARSGDGDISLAELSSEEIAVDTSDGDIRGSRLSGRISAHSSDGDIVVDGVAGAFSANTGDGDIHLEIDRLEETRLHTGEGDITISASKSLAAELDLRGTDVSIRNLVNFGGEVERRLVQGAINDGGPVLQARSGGGTIILHLR